MTTLYRHHTISRQFAVLGLLLAGILAGMAIPERVSADDWSQWLGNQRDSEWREAGIVEKLPASGPVYKWRTPISGGYSGPAVAGGRVYVMDYETDQERKSDPDARTKLTGQERVFCLDATTGQVIWQHAYDCPYEISYPAGPRATPTVDGDRVYTLGAEGDLRCLDTETGKPVWVRQLKKDFGAKTPLWGFCGHPLVDGDKLICFVGAPGKLVMALDKMTGQEIWSSLDGNDAGYSAPTIIEAGDARQLIVWHPTALTSVNPQTGESYWSEPLEPNYGMSIVTPRLLDNLLYVGGIVQKSMVVRLDSQKPAAEVVWRGAKEVGIDPVHSTPFAEDGTLYGVSREGALSAVEMETGKILWSTFEWMPDKRRAQSGTIFIVKHQDRFLLWNDMGELIVAELSPQGYEQLSRTKVLEPTTEGMGRVVLWSHPAFANRCMFARNDKEIVCVSLAADDYK